MKTIKLTLIQAGWETYTGNLGEVEFLDGTSIEEVPVRLAIRLGSDFTMVDQDGRQVTPIDYLMDHDPSSEQAGVETCLTMDQVAALEAAPRESIAPQRSESTFIAEPGKNYTREELEKIADSDGIDGLREVGDSLNVKGRAITDMIDKIIQAQAERAVKNA